MKFNKKIHIGNAWKILILILGIYLALFFINLDLFRTSLSFFFKILEEVIPIFAFIFVLMSITNYLITPQLVLKYVRKRGIKKWFFVVIAGILSAGPIYMWYPLLADLKSKGLSYGLIACFLYNRAIKIPLLPLMVFYFSLKYVLILTLITIFVSVFQGIIINKFMEVNK
jgi:uncharacterized membrane protein YraQ (UPF0718 family)